MAKVKVLGVVIDNLTLKKTLKIIREFLASSRQHYIVTVNPEFLVQVKKDEEFYHILNRADLSLADGFGIVLMTNLLPPRIKNHIRGADLTFQLLAQAEEKNQKVCLLNWQEGLSKRKDIEKTLKNKFPNLKFLVQDITREGGGVNWSAINSFAPQLLFVGLGAPYQEKFIYHNLKKISSVRVAMGVGGSFDFLTKKIKRVPKIMRKLELEWLWRLFKQPKRIKRILRATVIFPFLFLQEKLIHPFFYRPNVACFLYKKENNKIKVFLAEREDSPGHFQIPQGGTDGEKIAVAGQRELKEEIGTDKIKIKAVFKNVYKYKFTGKINGYKHSNYKGQKQSLLIAKFIGQDDDIKIFPYDFSNWKWIDINNVLKEIDPIRQEGMVRFLEKFKKTKIS